MYLNGDCEIMIDWIEPNDNGARVTAYKIEIQNHRAQWVQWNGQCSGTTECSIPMQMLGTQWDLDQGAMIKARVSAINLYGASLPGSAISSGIRMGGVPPTMARPLGTVTYPLIEVCFDEFNRNEGLVEGLWGQGRTRDSFVGVNMLDQTF
jgi:hypothetical protein